MIWMVAVGIFLAIFIFWLWLERWKLIQPSVIEAFKMAYRKHGVKFFIDGKAFNIVAYGRWIPQYIRVYQCIAVCTWCPGSLDIGGLGKTAGKTS